MPVNFKNTLLNIGKGALAASATTAAVTALYAFRDEIEAAGFRRASFTRLSGGIVAIHSGWKL